MNRLRFLLALVALAVLAGCASMPDNSEWLAMEQSRQARLDTVAAQCQTDLCLVMIAQEQGRSAIRPPQQQYHPAWQIADRALGLVIPAYFGWRQTEALTGAITGTAGVIAGIDRADYSVSIGRDNIGGDRIDDQSVSIGDDYTGGDRIRGRRVNSSGNDITNTGRWNSPGPFDIDNSENTGTLPPPEPDPDP